MRNPALKIENFTLQDLGEVASLQPEGWPDILPSIQHYCISSFCHPFKSMLDGKLAGIGTAIILEDTAWIAHIMVKKEYRNSGIGTAITQFLVDFIKRTPCTSILLIATSLGEPVYKKLGFETETEYVFFENGAFTPEHPSNKIKVFESKYEHALLEMNRSVYGEDRKKLFEGHLTNTLLFIEHNQLKGFYIPTLGEGSIIAESSEVGQALMTLRCASNKRFCLPIHNQDGINILIQHGFKEFRRASRMILGKKFSWNGSKIYSRVGGNLG